MSDREDPRITARTRQVMEQINDCLPSVRIEECPSLFAFGPIYRAIAEAEGRDTALRAALTALVTGDAGY